MITAFCRSIALALKICTPTAQRGPAWVAEDWSPARARKAAAAIQAKGKRDAVPKFWVKKYEEEAARNWDLFYKRNQANFYKDRHYIHKDFPELQHAQHESTTLFEFGCGVGNAFFPLLQELPYLQANPEYDPVRCTAFVHDAAKDGTPAAYIPPGGADCCLMLFMLSAVAPEYMAECFAMAFEVLRPGGMLLFRDYGRYDEAQLRFAPGHKLAENFYVRQDGTRAYYFSIEDLQDLAEGAGFTVVENKYICREYINRKTGSTWHRVWTQGRYQRPHAA